MSHETRTIPANAARFTIGSFALGDNGENAKTAPVTLLARTGQPIEHWYWGRVVHDLAGMQLHKPRLPIDYCHDSTEIIGYLNKFDIESGDLEASGALVPFRQNDRATEIVHKAKQGVPYEASINFGGDGIKIQEIGENELAEVNGYELEGPATIIRQWPLRGVAVCPYGADMNTESTFTNAAELSVAIITDNEDEDMSKDTELEAEEAVESTDETTQPEAEEVVDGEPETKAEEAPEADAAVEDAPEAEEAAEETAELTDGQKFLKAFGTQGAVWFAEGKTFDEAQALHFADLTTTNEKLQARIDELEAAQSLDRGGDEVVNLTPARPNDGPKSMTDVIAAKNRKE